MKLIELHNLLEGDDYDEFNPDTYGEDERKAFDVATVLFDRYEDLWTTDIDFDEIKVEAGYIIDDLPNATVEEIVQTLLKLNPELKPTKIAKNKLH